MSPSAEKAINELRRAGYAVCIWSPEDLKNWPLSPKHLEEELNGYVEDTILNDEE